MTLLELQNHLQTVKCMLNFFDFDGFIGETEENRETLEAAKKMFESAIANGAFEDATENRN